MDGITSSGKDKPFARSRAGDRPPRTDPVSDGPSGTGGPERAATAALPAGWRLVPVGTDKVPLLRNWPERAVPAAEVGTIGGWLRRWPGCALALLCGAESGVLVLDVDTLAGHAADGAAALAALQEELGALPEGPCAVTPSGGRHLFLGWPSGHARVPSRPLAPGLDLRASSALVTLPTLGRTPGRGWIVVPGAGGRLPPLPPLWRARILPLPPVPRPRSPLDWGCGAHPRYVEAALESAVRRVAGAVPGTRNTTLWREARSLARLDGLDPDDIARALAAAGRSAGLGPREIDATLRSALKHPAAGPRPPARSHG